MTGPTGLCDLELAPKPVPMCRSAAIIAPGSINSYYGTLQESNPGPFTLSSAPVFATSVLSPEKSKQLHPPYQD